MHLVAGFFDSPGEIGVFFVAWIPGAVLGGVVGYLIGRGKGQQTAGIVLGALLGCLGWVIVAFLPPNTAAAPPPTAGLPPLPAPGTASSAGWFADPFQRFQLRYFDGARWTAHVSTDGRQYTDDPTP